MKAMETVPKTSVPRTANVVGSPVQYIRKMNGNAKASICPSVNHDFENNELRIDAPSMVLEVFRLVVSIGVN